MQILTKNELNQPFELPMTSISVYYFLFLTSTHKIIQNGVRILAKGQILLRMTYY